MPYFYKTTGKYVHTKPPEELNIIQTDKFLDIAVAVVFVAEGNLWFAQVC